MKKKLLQMEHIPAILYGEESNHVYLFIHGKCGYKEEAESFAEVACERGYQVLSIDLPGYGERKEEIEDFVPWKVVPEIQMVMKYAKQRWDIVSLYAISFGAYCSLLAFQNVVLDNVLLVSPVVDMTKLIQNMMLWSNITEERLEKEKRIPTEFGETLDWQYYQYVKRQQIQTWNHPTKVFYAGKDNLTERDTMNAFVNKFNCKLTIMEEAEHWIHTPEELATLKDWIKNNI